jgi:hypothetical protein
MADKSAAEGRLFSPTKDFLGLIFSPSDAANSSSLSDLKSRRGSRRPFVLQAHQTLVKTEPVVRRKAEMVSIMVALPLATSMPPLLYEENPNAQKPTAVNLATGVS